MTKHIEYGVFGNTLVRANSHAPTPKYTAGVNCAAMTVDEFLQYGPKGKAYINKQERNRQTRRYEKLGRDTVNAAKREYYERPDRANARDRLLCEQELSRPIIALDAEGGDFPGADEYHMSGEDRVRFPRHETYLWCASAMADQNAIAGRVVDTPQVALVHPDTNGVDKHPLHAEQIVDWLLTLPEKFGGAMNTYRGKVKSAPVFVLFGSSYDLTMILKDMPLDKAYEIIKRKKRGQQDGPELHWTRWRGFVFNYVPGKWIEIKRLRDPSKENPYVTQYGQTVINPKTGSLILDTVGSGIKIYEAFGYFQTAFADVVDKMVQRDAATEYEQTLIMEMKATRGHFANETIEKIREYCFAECRLLAQEMTGLRKMIFELGLRPTDWHGPGATVTDLYKRKKMRAHFGDDISASGGEPGSRQEWARHAFAGARIEALKQGYAKSSPSINLGDKTGVLDFNKYNEALARWRNGGSAYNDPIKFLGVYDISSAYPSAMVQLPSLSSATGYWIELRRDDFNGKSLTDLRRMIESHSIVSLYEIRFDFPVIAKRYPSLPSVKTPMFPLFYRTKTGGILFPNKGLGRYNREDALAAISYIEKFYPRWPKRDEHEGQPIIVDIKHAHIWVETAHVRPFAFLSEYYEQRKEIKKSEVYNIMEMVQKLILNTVYGKTAQSRGREGKIPPTYNPFYAAAITANCRRRVLEAALIDPSSIVQFATDGIVTTRPLHGNHLGSKSLDRVRDTTIGDDVCLGDWEFGVADGGIFVGSGIYVYWKVGFEADGSPKIDKKIKAKTGELVQEKKPVEKLRGGSPKKYPTNDKGEPWLVAATLPLWRKGSAAPVVFDAKTTLRSLKGRETFPEYDIETALKSAKGIKQLILDVRKNGLACGSEFDMRALLELCGGRKAQFLLAVEQPYKKFIGATQALTPERWKIAGRWSPDVSDLKWGDLSKRLDGYFYRKIDVHKPGGKRELDFDNLNDFCSIRGSVPGRCARLIDTIPILNDDTEMSRPSIPEWLLKDRIEMNLELENEDDIMIRATRANDYAQSELGEGEDTGLAQFLD